MKDDVRTSADREKSITVFVLSYNRPSMLKEAISSLLAQTLTPARIVILDNGSTPENLESILKLEGGLVSVISTSGDHTAKWNFHRALDLADNNFKSEYIYIMHDDDRVLPPFLEKMVDLLESHPEYSAATSHGFIIDKSGKRTRYWGGYDPSEEKIFHDPAEVALLYSEGVSVPFPFMVYRNGMAQKVREPVDMGIMSDVVWCCLLAEVGPFIKSDMKLFEYRMHGSQESACLDETLFERRDRFLVSIVSAENPLWSTILRNLSVARTSRSLSRSMNHLRKRDITAGFRTLSNGLKDGSIRIRNLLSLGIIFVRYYLVKRSFDPGSPVDGT